MTPGENDPAAGNTFNKQLKDVPKDVVLRLIGAARALSLAHFRTAEHLAQEWRQQRQRPFGARAADLQIERQLQGVSEKDWRLLETSMQDCRWALTYNDQSDAFDVWKTSTIAHGAAFRPEPYQLVREIVSGRAPEELLVEWYRQDLRDHYLLEDSPACLAFILEWCRAFNSYPESIIPRRDLLILTRRDGPSTVSQAGALGRDAENAARESLWSESLIELLGYLAILGEPIKHHAAYKRKMKVDPAFAITSLLGKSTGVPGLDFLLFGGLRHPSSPKRRDDISIGISGPPGVGKSTLGLALGVQAAARGGLCLYLTFEVDNHAIVRQAIQFHRRYLPFIHIEPETGLAVERGPDVTGFGRLLAERVDPAPFPELKTSIFASIESAAPSLGASSPYSEKTVVLDSINLRDQDCSLGEYRERLHQLSESLRALGWTVIILLEVGADDRDTAADFMVDLNIRLSVTKSDQGYQHRSLEIVKSRWQMSHRGPHLYSIVTDRGMCVYPSSAAVLASRGPRSPRAGGGIANAIEPIDPGIVDFARCFGEFRQRPGTESSAASMPSSQNRVSWWRDGSTTAFIGERGTLKTECAQKFVNSKATKGSSLFVHFADDFTSDPKGKRRLVPSEFGQRADTENEDRLRPGAVATTHTELLFRAGYLSAGQILQELRDLFEEKRRSGIGITRVAVADLGNIALDFPLLKEDPSFIIALRELFSTELTTQVLVYSLPKHGAPDYVIDQVRSLAENILHFEQISVGGNTYRGLSVLRSLDAGHLRGLVEVRKEGKEIRVERNFDLLFNPGMSRGPLELQAATVKMILHWDTQLQRSYVKALKASHRGVGAYQITSVPVTSSGLTRDRVPSTIVGSEHALWIVQRDAYAIEMERQKPNSSSAQFSDLRGHHEALDRVFSQLVHVKSEQVAAGRTSQAAPHEMKSIPYFLNPSFLTADDRFVEFCRDDARFSAIAKGVGRYTWEVIRLALKAFGEAQDPKVENPEELFDCPVTPGESLNCLFLEIICGMCVEACTPDGDANAQNHDAWEIALLGGKDTPYWFEGASALRAKNGVGSRLSQHDLLHGAAIEFYKLVHARVEYHREDLAEYTSGQKKGRRGAFKKDRRRSSIGANRAAAEGSSEEGVAKSFAKPVLWRHWYTSFRQECAEHSHRNARQNPGLMPLQLPGGIWTCGDWHIGILEGSIGVRQGARILYDELVSRDAAISRMVFGAGLTPYRKYYDHKEVLPVTRREADWFKSYVEQIGVIYRSRINGYDRIQYLLTSYLRSIMQLRRCDDNSGNESDGVPRAEIQNLIESFAQNAKNALSEN